MKKITIRLTSLLLSAAMGFSFFQSTAVTYAQSERTALGDTAFVGYSLDNEGIRQQVSVEEDNKNVLQDYPILGASESYSLSGTGYIYDMLNSDEERELYDRFLNACTIVQESDDDYTCTPYARYYDLGLTSSEAQEVAWIFHYDNPQFFWMEPSYWYGSSGLRFELYDCYQDGTDRTQAQAQFDASAQEYIDGAMQYDTERERSYYLFEALNEKISYGSGDLDQSAASALIDGVTVCAGFSKAYQMLCEAVGVEALSMVSENHAWNAIKLSGEWYLTDITYGIYGYTNEEMHSLDVKRNNYHTMTITYSDGTKETISFYVHDISSRTYPTYYDSFPVCNTLLTDASGSSVATTTIPGGTTNATTTSSTAITTTTTTTTISQQPTAVIIAEPDEADLFIGNTFSLSYTAESTLRWFSSDSDVAKIDSTGNVTVTGYGTVTILAIDKNGKSAELLLTIQPKNEIITGDADMDGTVSLADASIALTIYANISAGLSADTFTQEQFNAADVNGDGTITIADVAAILTYYAHTSAGLSADWNEILG